jgi:alkylhydroperoxidase/carboxymuconolactone decarboxylase family protein YurZ
LVTISVISAIDNATPMLKGHLFISLNVGITPGQLKEFVSIIKETIGQKEAASAHAVLEEVLKRK